MAQAEEEVSTPAGSEMVTIQIKGADGKPVRVKMQRRELVRRAMSTRVAEQTIYLAKHVHITEKGKGIKLDAQWARIYADPSTDMRIISPAQRGKTTYQVVKTMAQLSLGMSVGWVMPKYNKIQELVNGKINPTIRNTPFYAEMQRDSSGVDQIQFKTFGKYGRLYLVTANSEDDLTSFSADAMHVDERDFCDRNLLPMYTSRMNASDYRLADEISTPTVPGAEHIRGQRGNDNIHTEFLCGDQHRYWSRCPYCQTEQILDWYENVVKIETDDSGRIIDFGVRDQDWSPGAQNDARVCCKSCERPFDRLREGRWIAHKPGRRVRSYWVEALATEVGPSISEMVDRFGKALGNPSKMQQFHNMDLGRPYAGGMLAFTRDMFIRCSENSHWMMTSSDGPCTIGIDVNMPWLDIQISRWKAGRQIKAWAGRIQGDETQILALCKKFGVVGGIIDNQPEARFATKTQELLRENGISLVRCKYASSDQLRMVVVSVPGENPAIDPPRLITVNRTNAIDDLFESMLKKDVVWFRDWENTLDGAMVQEFLVPQRKLLTSDAGNDRYSWEGKPDHQMHAAVYDLLAGSVLEMGVVRDYSGVMPVVGRQLSGGGSIMPKEPVNEKGKNVQKSDSVMIFRG
jgi:hypothetical protein